MAGRLDAPLEDLPDPLAIQPVEASRTGSIDLRCTPPGSKSMTNRALLLGALGGGRSVVRGVLRGADDTERMIEAVRSLGARVEDDPGDPRGTTLLIEGVDGRWRVPRDGAVLDLGNAGTATRFLAGSALLASGPVTIDGNARMRQRPIGELGEALRAIGARVEYLGAEGCPPLRITPPAPGSAGTSVRLGRTQSGQFISALLLAAPWLARGLTIQLDAAPTSASYVSMTLSMLARLGVPVRMDQEMRVLRVGRAGAVGGGGFAIDVEPDASSATYWWAAAALLPGARCIVEGLGEGSLQGDAGLPGVLARMGVETGQTEGAEDEAGWFWCRGPERLGPVMADCGEMPDAAVTLAVVCAFAEGASVLRGVRTLRVKECDRIAALRAELGKIGVEVRGDARGDPDVMTITPPEGGVDTSADAAPVVLETYDDHRMAMALSLVGLRRAGVSIADPGCVAKTYPGFWRELARFYE